MNHSSRQRPLNTIFLRLLWSYLFTPLMLSALVLVITGGLVAGQVFRQQQENLNRSVSYNVSSFLYDATNVLEMLALRIPSSDVEQMAFSMEVVQKGYEFFDAFYYLDETGRVLTIAPLEPQYLNMDFSRQWYYLQARSAPDVVISQPFLSLRSGHPSVYLAKNVPGYGVIAGELSLNALQQMINLGVDMTLGSETFITDREGTLLAHPVTDLVDQQTNVGRLPILQHARQGDLNMLYLDGSRIYSGSASMVQNSGWIVVSQAHLLDVLRPYYHPLALYILISALVLATFLRLFSRQFENHVSAPLGRLSSAASSVASGKYDGSANPQAPQAPFLELSALWDAFTHMAGSVRARERLLQHLANHDPLTDLPNRTLIQRKLAEMIAAARAKNSEFAVLFIDLDDFKTINDAFGHQTGDLVLKHITNVLDSAAGEHGTPGRLGGDEFAILLEGPEAGEAAGPLSRALLRELTQPMHIEGNEIYLSASIGISIYPLDGQAPDTLIQNADTAMYQAKDEGKNAYLYYSLEMETRAQERLRLRSSLHHALEQEEFHLVYQPIYRACTRDMASTEALARWNSQRFGAVPPSSFIPLANETGLILPLGDWVLRTACAQNLRLAELGLPGQRVSVNVTERQLRQKNFIDTVQRALEDTGLPPELLTLELTENIFFQGFKEIDRLLLNVKRLGVHLSLDDFGIGYATLSCLTQIPFDEIKIDRSLAHNIAASPGDAAIVRGIIRIAHDLGMQVVAEGIENEQQLRFFENLGCDLLQGYYFSKPITGAELEMRVLQLAR